MGIKWREIKVLNSPLTNSIYIGKTDKTGRIATDKSDDRTEEMKSAVIAHMDNLLKDGEKEVTFECGAGTLTWKRTWNTKS